MSYRLLLMPNGRLPQRWLVLSPLEAAFRVLAVGFVDTDSVSLLPAVATVLPVFARVQATEVPYN